MTWTPNKIMWYRVMEVLFMFNQYVDGMFAVMHSFSEKSYDKKMQIQSNFSFTPNSL